MRSSINSIIILKKQPDYIVADLKAITVLKKIQTLLNYHYIMKIFLNLKKGVEYLVENYTLLYFCSSITANSVPMLLNDYEKKKLTNFLGIITSLTGKNHSQP